MLRLLLTKKYLLLKKGACLYVKQGCGDTGYVLCVAAVDYFNDILAYCSVFLAFMLHSVKDQYVISFAKSVLGASNLSKATHGIY